MDIFGFGKQNNEASRDNEKDKSEEIASTLSSLKETIEGINTRLDSLEQRFETAPLEETPQEETETEEKWQPTTWQDIPLKAREIAEEVVNQKFQEIEEQRKQQARIREAQEKQIDAFINSQLDAREKNGSLPKLKEPLNEPDPGCVARRELLGFAARLGASALIAASEFLNEFLKIGMVYDPRANNMKGAFIKANATPSGINAPVASPSRGNLNVQAKPDYKTIHNAKNFSQLIAKVAPDLS